MFPKMQKPFLGVMLTCLACFACGCASIDFLKFGKEDFPKADAKNPVVQILSMWQPTHGVDTNGRNCRGFAGQILFLTRDNPVPAKVDGTVRIYVFDDQGKPEDQLKPIHQFDFPGDAWNVQARISKLGLTYGVFIPYTRPGAHEANCSLKVRFIPKEGQGRTVYSEMCNVELPGISKKKPDTESADEIDLDDEYTRKAVKVGRETARGRVELASYEEMAGSPNNRQVIDQIAAQAFREANAKASTAPRKLPPQEEQRIIREMQAQMGGTLTSGEENRTAKAKAARLRGRNPLEDANPAVDSDDEDAPVYTRQANRPVSRRSHLLADDSSDDSEFTGSGDSDLPPVSTKTNRAKTAKPARHPLDVDEAPETARRNRKWGEALTIDLSEVR